MPEPSAELVEGERTAWRFVDDLLGTVAHEGAEPGQPLVQQGQDAARAGRARIGEPAKAVPLPSMAERSPEMDGVIAGIGDELLAKRKADAEFRKDYGKTRTEPLEKTTVVGALSSWTLLLVLGAVLLSMMGVQVLPALVRFGVGIYKQAKAAREIIVGVEKFKKQDATLGAKAALGARLKKSTETSKATIRKIKKDEGLT